MINLSQIVNEGEYDVVIMIISNDLLKIVRNNIHNGHREDEVHALARMANFRLCYRLNQISMQNTNNWKLTLAFWQQLQPSLSWCFLHSALPFLSMFVRYLALLEHPLLLRLTRY
jgi:hypothetical protein